MGGFGPSVHDDLPLASLSVDLKKLLWHPKALISSNCGLPYLVCVSSLDSGGKPVSVPTQSLLTSVNADFVCSKSKCTLFLSLFSPGTEQHI